MDNQYLMGEIYSFDRTYHDKYKEFVREYETLTLYDYNLGFSNMFVWSLAEYFQEQAQQCSLNRFDSVKGTYNPFHRFNEEFYKFNLHLYLKYMKNPQPFLEFYTNELLEDTEQIDLGLGHQELDSMFRFYYPNLEFDSDEFENIFNSVVEKIKF